MVILLTRIHRCKDRQGSHHNLLLDMVVNPLQVTRTYWTSTSIRIRAYKAPGTSLWIRYAFLVDTTMEVLRARTYVGFTWIGGAS
jgi:hypothetical protein